MAIDVFISVGRTSTTEQEAFVSSIKKYLIDHGLTPQAVGRSNFSPLQPLNNIKQLMDQCGGTLVIAFKRIRIRDGHESRGDNTKISIRNEDIPTVWNHLEAGMAYSLGHPLLVVAEQGLRNEGILESGHDWYILRVDLNAPITNNPEFAEIFTEWKKQIYEFNKMKEDKDV